MKNVRTVMAAQINASRDYSIEPEEEGLVMFGGPVSASRDMVHNFDDECCNCAFSFGLHHSETNQCPVPPGPVSEGADPWEKDRKFKPVVSAARTDEGIISVQEAAEAQMGTIRQPGEEPIARVKECKLDSNGMVASLELTDAGMDMLKAARAEPKRPYCPECGHHDVSTDATAEWCTLTNDWVLKDTYDGSGGCCECEATELKRFDWFTDAEHTAHWQAKLDEKGKELALSVDKEQGVLYRTEQLPNGGVKLFLKLTEKGKLSFAKEMGLPSANMGSFAAISLGD